MAQFEDEKRIREKMQIEQSREQAEKKAEEEAILGSIFDEQVEILGQQCSFERRRIGELPCSMVIPTQFQLLTDEEKGIIYPRAKPPLYAYASDNLFFSMAVNYTESPLKKSDVRVFVNISDRLIETLIAKARVVKKIVKGTEEFPIGYIEFTSSGFDGYIYNLMLIASVNDKMMNICLSTKNEYQKLVLPFFNQMGETLRLEEYDE